ncbi:MAG: cation transporter, partial [Acutalibacteraceae bacterium]|nr:cation transporter [Acutalibacteraceae bacterium]
MKQYNVTGMSCAACSARVEKAVSSLSGVTACSVNLLTNSMVVEGNATESEIIEAVKKSGYGAYAKSSEPENTQNNELEDKETPVLKKRLFTSLGFLIILMYISMGHTMWGFPLPVILESNPVAIALLQLLLAATVMIINKKFFINGFKGILHGAPNMDTLVALGSGASFIWSTIKLFEMTASENPHDYLHSFYFESAAMILTLITVGKMLEARSKGKTTNALKSLMSLTPKTATIIKNGTEIQVPVAKVKKGDIFIVKAGESIAIVGHSGGGKSTL